MACKLGTEDYDYHEIDLNEKTTKNGPFLKVNPSGTIPFVEEGQFKVLGGSYHVYIFLCKNASNVGKLLLPEELDT